MGIKGTVRRTEDSDFIHANIDTDLIITEQNEYGNTDKPVEIFNIIEHFCLGKKRYVSTTPTTNNTIILNIVPIVLFK